MQPFQPLGSLQFSHAFFFFFCHHSFSLVALQYAAKIKAKGQFKLLRPAQFGASSPHPLFSAYAATGHFLLAMERLRHGQHRLQRQVPRYIARHLAIRMSP